MQMTTGDQSPVIEAKGDVSVSYGLSKEQFKAMLKQQRESIVMELQGTGAVFDEQRRFLLKQKEKDIQEKLDDLQKSYEVELKRRKAADEALEQLKNLLSVNQKQVSVQLTIGGQSPVITAGRDAIINYNLTRGEFANILKQQQEGLVKDIKELREDDTRQRGLLEQKLHDVQGKLSDIEKSYEEELKKRKAVDEALAQMQGQLPEAQIEKAQISLRQGDTAAAENAFDAVDDQLNQAHAFAVYHSGQLAEGRLDYAKAMRKYKKAVVLEDDNPNYLLAAGKMARTMADYRQAEEWLKDLLKIREDEKDELVLADVLNELATLYYRQGHYAKAESMYNRTLSIREKSLGKTHPLVATTLNNLALIYDAQGRYDKAEKLYRRALAYREKILGCDHHDVAESLNNLAEIYREQGEVFRS